MTQPSLTEVKRKVSSAVLKIPGVSGVGLPAQGLTIYLEKDSPEVRAAVNRALEALDVRAPVHWEVSGKFLPRG